MSPENEHEEPKFILKKQEDLPAGLDPKLQDAAEKAKTEPGARPAFGLWDPEREPELVNVIARLKDPDIEVPGLNVVRVIGATVTGTVDVRDIQAVREHENVAVLNAATDLRMELDVSVPEIRADQAQVSAGTPPGTPALDGSGVIVGVVDYGCDFAHENFRTPAGTRLLYLWDQNGRKNQPQGFGYGREYLPDEINAALDTDDPYHALGYKPAEEAHGTHVMDIAAGNGRATGNPGVAPGAGLVFVHVATNDYSAEQNFGDSRHLLEAVDYIFSKADGLGLPAVINISLGTHGGPHDGTTLVEQAFDDLLATPGRAIVISAGNSWTRRSHAADTVEVGGKRILMWQVQQQDDSNNEVEIWYPKENQLALTLITLDDQILGPVGLNQKFNLELEDGETLGRIIHQQSQIGNGDCQINILLDKRLYGDWRIQLQNVGSERAPFHAWIERDNRKLSRFAEEHVKRSHTIGSISCGKHTIAVGSYDAEKSGKPLSSFSAEGPTRDGKNKPEISAPGQNIMAANALTQGAIGKNGTSMAAPHVAGVVALMMQAAGHVLPIGDLRQALIATARKDPPPGNPQHHPRYGTGRVDGLAALLTQLGD